jgi:hypothetical protein
VNENLADPNKIVGAIQQQRPKALARHAGSLPACLRPGREHGPEPVVEELLDLFCQFLDKSLARGSVERIIKTYALAKCQKQHEPMWTLQYSKYGGGIGSGVQTLKTGNEATDMMCSRCLLGDGVREGRGRLGGARISELRQLGLGQAPLALRTSFGPLWP